MTKIKDLVTVTVDNTFRLYPIDSERYDLAKEVWRCYDALTKGATMAPLDQIVCSQKQSFLEQVDINFSRSARAFAFVTQGPSLFEPTAIAHDRSRRVIAAFGEDVCAGIRGTLDERIRFTYVRLWLLYANSLQGRAYR
jgi:hypothetical protein